MSEDRHAAKVRLFSKLYGENPEKLVEYCLVVKPSSFHDIGKEELLTIKIWLEGHIEISDNLIKEYEAEILQLDCRDVATVRREHLRREKLKTHTERSSLKGALYILKEQLKDDYEWMEKDGSS